MPGSILCEECGRLVNRIYAYNGDWLCRRCFEVRELEDYPIVDVKLRMIRDEIRGIAIIDRGE